MQPASFHEQDVNRILKHVEDRTGGAAPSSVRIRDDHSNMLAEVRFSGGRTLVIKQARYVSLSAGFDASRIAADLLHERTDVIAPHYFTVDDRLLGAPVLVYWRIEHPTLEDLWPNLDEGERRGALRSWGALTRRIHTVRLPGSGHLRHAYRERMPLRRFLQSDFEERLLPSLDETWEEGAALAHALSVMLPEVEARASRRANVLVHGDLFAANVLCRRKAGVDCVGVIDFEDAFAGPPEAELARTEILHGPLFGRHWPGDWFGELRAGYDEPLDPVLMSFFRMYHMLNMGFHAAQIGLNAHAAQVAEAARREREVQGRGMSHEEALRPNGHAG